MKTMRTLNHEWLRCVHCGWVVEPTAYRERTGFSIEPGDPCPCYEPDRDLKCTGTVVPTLHPFRLIRRPRA